MPLVFEWNAQKARSNFQKHRVSFDEACTVFEDPLAAIFPDGDHPLEKAREIIIGLYRALEGSSSNLQRAQGDTPGAERL